MKRNTRRRQAERRRNRAPVPAAQLGLPRGADAHENTPASRWEKLVIQMNQKVGAWDRVPGAGVDHDAMQVWAALGAAKIPELSKALLVYMATGDRKARSAVWYHLLCLLLQWRETEQWNSRTPGVLDRMALYAIYHISDPHQYDQISARRWSSMLGVSCHKDYARYWRPRYNRVLEELHMLAEDGIEAVAMMNGTRGDW